MMATRSEKLNNAKPGVALRTLRKERGWTLAEVSRRTGMPVSTLSKVENNKLSLSYDKLARLSEGMEVDISQFFGASAEPGGPVPERPTGRRSITRAGDGKVIETENYRHVYAAADLKNKRFIPVLADIRARTLAEFGELIRHAGEEYVFVVEGEVEFHSSLYTPTRLGKGDGMYFDSGMPHAYLAVGDGLCRILSICSGAESRTQLDPSFGLVADTGDVIPLRPADRAPGERN
jgi:transcriptional regulator with XRE-family HTH domain